MHYLLEDLLEKIIPVLILLGALSGIYGIFCFFRFCYRKIKIKMTGSIQGKLTYKQKKNILNVIKILGGTQVLGLLFYITPVINENIKFMVSLLLMLGGFIGAFLIENNKGNNTVYRTLVFLGQEFFGISMIILMVNKGLGYTISNIFGIWTLYNFFIYRKTKNTESKVFFITTLLVFLSTFIPGTVISNILSLEEYITIIGLVIILILINLLLNTENKYVKILNNILNTGLFVSVLVAVGSKAEKQEIIFIAVLIYLVIMFVSRISKLEINLKAAYMYIPYIVVLALSEMRVEVLYLLTVFNSLLAIWISLEESKYKKVLSAVGLFSTLSLALNNIIVDKTLGLIIYIVTVFVALLFLFTPSEKIYLDKGEDLYEE